MRNNLTAILLMTKPSLTISYWMATPSTRARHDVLSCLHGLLRARWSLAMTVFKQTPLLVGMLLSLFFLEGCGNAPNPTPQIVLLPHQVMVAPGETIYSIAYREGVSTRSLIEANRLPPPFMVKPGQVLTLPSREMAFSSPPPPVEKSFEPFKEEGPVAIHKSLEPLPSLPGKEVPPEKPLSSFPLKKENVLPPEPLQSSVARELDLELEQAHLSQKKEKPQPPSPSPAKPSQPALSSEVSSEKFPWPVQGKVIGKYGRSAGGKDGILIAAPKGERIKAIQSGKVIYAGDEIKNLGNLVLIDHHNGWITAYGHTQNFLVQNGDAVTKGQEIAQVGQTGEANQPQLYFEMRKDKKTVDPLSYLRP